MPGLRIEAKGKMRQEGVFTIGFLIEAPDTYCPSAFGDYRVYVLDTGLLELVRYLCYVYQGTDDIQIHGLTVFQLEIVIECG